MDAEIARLCKFLADIKQLLDEAGEARWAAWIGRDLTLVENLDAYGLEHFLSAFGGMGSINDVVIHPANGHQIASDEVDAINEKLRTLLETASSLARELLAEEREANREQY